MKTIGVIGLGSIGMRHAKNLLALGHRVVGYDPDSARMKAFLLPDNGDVGWFLPGRDQSIVDGMVIACPIKDHLSQWANIDKHVFIEKPIATTEDFDVARDELEAREGLVTMVGNNLRFHSCVKKAKEWLGAGLIGKPMWANFVVAQFTDKPVYLRDGVLLNWLSHEVDLALYLLGPAKLQASYVREDIADLILDQSDAITTIHGDYLSKPQRRGFVVQGTDGYIHADLEHRTIHLTDTGDSLVEHHKFDDSWDINYMDEMTAFLTKIDGQEALGASGEEGLAVLEILLQAREKK